LEIKLENIQPIITQPAGIADSHTDVTICEVVELPASEVKSLSINKINFLVFIK